MKLNKKGFTLTELLVVIVILGIITGISIPLIRGLSASFEKRKYTNYADSVLSASKLYNDSYSEDLFGHKEYGCAYIKYEDLVKRDLLKDIQIENISCNSENTYVRVIKQKDKYGYSNYLSCGKKVKGKASNVTTSIPTVIPTIDEISCSGVEDNNLLISADETQVGNVFDKKRKKTKLTITSGTGINNNIVIYTKWSTNRNDYSDSGFSKTTFKVKSNQEKELLNGNIITTTSSELLTPSGVSGEYYLIVRVDNLQDLYGSKWKNPNNTDSRYVSFGPFSVDNEKPTILANIYKCDTNHVKTGDVLKNKTVNDTGNLTLFNISGNVDGWINKVSYANGICFEYKISDNGGVNDALFEWNKDNLENSDANYKNINGSDRKTYENKRVNETYETYISGNGHRYVKFTAKDLAGNTSSIEIESKIDRTNPTCEWTGESTTWTNSNRTIKVTGSDTGGSGMDNDHKTKSWTYNTGTTKEISLSYDILDKAGNKKTCEKEVSVYVDKNKPTCEWTGESTTWTNSNRTIKVTGSDTGGSGMDNDHKTKSWAYTNGTIKTASLSFVIKDKVGNSETCSKTANIYVDKDKPTCGAVTKTSTGTSGVSGNVKCSDTTGCNTVSFSNLKSTQNVTITDGVGNTNGCSVSVSTSNCEKYSESYSCNQPVQYDCSYSENYDCSYNESYDCSYNTSSTCTGTKTNSAAECSAIGGRWSQAGYYGVGGQGTCTYSYSCTKRVQKTCSRRVSKTCSRTVPKTCWRDNWVTCWRDAWKTCYN